MHRTKALLNQLTKFYWSPHHPSTYVIENAGVGNIAHHDYGAFNLIWAGYPLETIDQQKEAVAAFAVQSTMNDQLIGDTPLGDLLTLISMQQLPILYMNHAEVLTPVSRQNIARAMKRWKLTDKTC